MAGRALSSPTIRCQSASGSGAYPPGRPDDLQAVTRLRAGGPSARVALVAVDDEVDREPAIGRIPRPDRVPAPTGSVLGLAVTHRVHVERHRVRRTRRDEQRVHVLVGEVGGRELGHPSPPSTTRTMCGVSRSTSITSPYVAIRG